MLSYMYAYTYNIYPSNGPLAGIDTVMPITSQWTTTPTVRQWSIGKYYWIGVHLPSKLPTVWLKQSCLWYAYIIINMHNILFSDCGMGRTLPNVEYCIHLYYFFYFPTNVTLRYTFPSLLLGSARKRTGFGLHWRPWDRRHSGRQLRPADHRVPSGYSKNDSRYRYTIHTCTLYASVHHSLPVKLQTTEALLFMLTKREWAIAFDNPRWMLAHKQDLFQAYE